MPSVATRMLALVHQILGTPFAALVGACDVAVAGDMIAMHLVLPQHRPTTVLFGTTSHQEIDLFRLGRKIYPNMGCLCCCLTTGDNSRSCTQEISADSLFDHQRRAGVVTSKRKYV